MEKAPPEKAVSELFNALFSLTDLRVILREAKPNFKFTDAQKTKAKNAIESAKKSLAVIENFFE